MMVLLSDVVSSIDWNAELPAVATAVVLQALVGFFIYGVFLPAAWQRSVAIDKGMRSFDQVKLRFSSATAGVATLLTHGIRATIAVLLLVVANAGRAVPMDYVRVGAALSLLECTTVNNAVWQQRPVSLVVITVLAVAALGQACVFGLYALRPE